MSVLILIVFIIFDVFRVVKKIELLLGATEFYGRVKKSRRSVTEVMHH